jgi:hypothetical protein
MVKKWTAERDPNQQRHILRSHGLRAAHGLAKNPHLDPEILMDLLDVAMASPPVSAHQIALRETLAHNPTCPEHVADELLIDLPSVDARNDKTPAEVLDYLALSGSRSVRINVAQNPNCAAKTLLDLSTDIDMSVRRSVAENPNSPSVALLRVVEMIDDSDADPDIILMSVAGHRNATPELLDAVMMMGGNEAESIAERNPRNRFIEAMLEVVVESAYDRYRFALDCGADPMTAAASVIRAGQRNG